MWRDAATFARKNEREPHSSSDAGRDETSDTTGGIATVKVEHSNYWQAQDHHRNAVTKGVKIGSTKESSFAEKKDIMERLEDRNPSTKTGTGRRSTKEPRRLLGLSINPGTFSRWRKPHAGKFKKRLRRFKSLKSPRLNTCEQTDARVEFLVVNEHKMTVRWRNDHREECKGTCAGKNMRSSDSGGTSTSMNFLVNDTCLTTVTLVAHMIKCT